MQKSNHQESRITKRSHIAHSSTKTNSHPSREEKNGRCDDEKKMSGVSIYMRPNSLSFLQKIQVKP